MIKAIRAVGMTVPIILATSIPEGKLEAKAKAGFDAYLGKPFFHGDLLNTIAQVLAKT